MKKTTLPKKKMAISGAKAKYKKSLPKAQDGKFQQLNTLNPNYKMDKEGAIFPRIDKPDYTSNNTNLLGRNVKTDYDVEKGTIRKTVTNRKGEVVRQAQPRVLNSKKVERKMTRQMGRDASTDPSESSGSFARKGTIVKKKMTEGGTATNKKSPVSDTGMRKRFASPIGQAKRGGATKAKRFAALAPPYNKATAADRIAGAKKKNKRK